MRNMVFRNARRDEAETILALYKAVVGTPFCAWDEAYPGPEEISHDMENGGLFVLEADGRVIGAISTVHENELDALDCWHSGNKAGEFARVVIHPDFQGRRLAQSLVSGVLDEMKRRGYENVHISVAQENIPAQKTYRRLGFVVVGQKEMWGHTFCLCELEI